MLQNHFIFGPITTHVQEPLAQERRRLRFIDFLKTNLPIKFFEVRELSEELGVHARTERIVHSGVLEVAHKDAQTKHVFIVAYLCTLLRRTGAFESEGEDGAAEFQLTAPEDIAALPMPEIYREAITRATGG